MKFFSPFIKRQGNGHEREVLITPEWAAERRHVMVEEQLRKRGVRDSRVLEAMEAVPRHDYLPAMYLAEAYEDHPVAIGHGQTISQPYIVAQMIEALELEGSERVLEIGTGSGYEAAVLARLAAHVYTIENQPELFRSATERLKRYGLNESITVVLGDGSLGYSPAAPYDAILVIPVGTLENQELRKMTKRDGNMYSQVLGQCRFVPLTGQRGWERR